MNTVSVTLTLILTTHLTTIFQLPVFSSLTLGSVLIALGQWWSIQPLLRRAYGWLLATSISLVIGIQSGFLVGWIVLLQLDFTQPKTALLAHGIVGWVGGSWLGMVVGTAQWLVLRRHIPTSWRWIPISALGWGLGCMVGFALPQGLKFAQGQSVAEMPFWLELVSLMVGLAIASSITGAELARLLLRSPKHTDRPRL